MLIKIETIQSVSYTQVQGVFKLLKLKAKS